MHTDCAQAREALSAAFDGEADAAEAAAQAHLAECGECTRWYANMTSINRRLRVSAVAPTSARSALTERVLSLIDLQAVCGCGDRCRCADPCGCGDLCACRQGA